MRGHLRPPWVLLILFVVTLPLVTYKIRGADEIEYYSYLRSLAFDHDLDFTNEYRHFYDQNPQGLEGFKATFLDGRSPDTGLPINFAPIGSAVLWSPFFGLAHLGVVAARALGAQVPADGYALPYVVAVSLGSALYALLGLWLTYAALVRWGEVRSRVASVVVVAIWLGTPLLYYTTIAPTFSHACSVFATALLLWRWLAVRESSVIRQWILLGVLGGVAGLVREQDLFLLAVPAVDACLQAWPARAWRAAASRIAALVAGSFVGFLPQIAVYHVLNGSFTPSRHVAHKMTFTSPHALQVLFDPGHGFFLWTPLAFVATAGLLWALRKGRRAIVGPLLVGYLTQIWLNGSVESWSQAGAFGSRRFLSLTFILAWGLAVVVGPSLRRFRRTTVVVLALLVWWNVSLMIQFGLRLMDRQRLEWPRVAVNQVVGVPPRLGRTAWLFLVDRERLVRESR
jgi:hypothetical protein